MIAKNNIKKEVYMSFEPGDKVVHPKRPEWGVGTVLPQTSPQIWVVHFSTAGEKQLRRDLVKFEKWNEDSQKAEVKSELKSFTWKEKPSYQPKFFPREFSYSYPPKYKSEFIGGGLSNEWARKWPILFNELDVESLSVNNVAKFYSWLGSILVFSNLNWTSFQIQWNRLTNNNHDKLLADLWGQEWLDFALAHQEEFGYKSMPGVVAFDTVYHRKALIWIKESDEVFTKEQISFIKKSVKEFQVENFIVRVAERARFDI